MYTILIYLPIRIALTILKSKQPHTIAEELIVRCAKYIVKCIDSQLK